MKKLILYTLIMIIICCLSGCNDTYTTSPIRQETITTKQEIEPFTKVYTELNYEEELSVFEGQLPTYNIDLLPIVNLSVEEDKWYINGQKYVLEKSTYSRKTLYSQGVWEINLNGFVPIGFSNSSIVVFSPTGNFDSSVLIVTDRNILYLLVLDGFLNPLNYNSNDFKCVQPNAISESLLNSLWETHINTTQDKVSLVLDGEESSVKIQMKDIPSISYIFWYGEYKGNYYTNAPYEPKTWDGSLS